MQPLASSPDIWVVIAAYNEAGRIGPTLDRLCRHYANVVVVDDGSRDNTEAEALGRWLVLKIGVLFTRVFSRVRVTDAHNGLRALSREAARRIRIAQDRMAHASEILDEIRAHRLRYTEVPVTIHYTADSLAKGQSSWNAFKIVGQLILGRFIR
jgi:hypothetical protein